LPDSLNWEICLTTSGKELLGTIVEDERKTADELAFLYRSANGYFAQKGLAQLSDSEMSSAISKFLLANLAHFMNKRAIHLEEQSGEFDLNFVKYLFDVAFADRNIETIIEKMWKGLILLNSMSNDKSRKRVDAFSQTLELYIDTNVVFSLLGLHNPIFSRGINELFQLIGRIPQIKVYVFDETLAEFERLLDVFDRIKDSFYEIEVDSVFYYLKKNRYDRSKILLLKDSMEALLSEKGISIRSARGLENDISEYYMKLFGDIYGFRKARNSKLPVDSQRNDDQLQKSSHHDAKVISNVLAMKNKRTRNIQEAKALFLTSSGSLYSDYLRIARKIENYPCVIRDIALTNWLYIINPSSNGGPQLESILGMHSSSLFVDRQVWQKYILSLKEMMVKDQISPRQFALLVSNNRAVIDFLMAADSESLTSDAIRRILEELAKEEEQRKQVVANAESTVAQSKVEVETLSSEIAALRAQLENEQRRTAEIDRVARERYIRTRVRKFAFGRATSVLLYVAFLASAVGTYYLQQRNPLFWSGLALFLVPFIRSLVRHENLWSSIKYLLVPKFRQNELSAVRVMFQQEFDTKVGTMQA
jgi:hypothetical protein